MGVGEPGHTGRGLCPCFPAASQPHRLAVPGGGLGAWGEHLLAAVRAACLDRGPGIFAGGPGVRLAGQLDLAHRFRHARLRVPAVPDRAVALTAVAACRMVRGWGVDADHRRLRPQFGKKSPLVHRGWWDELTVAPSWVWMVMRVRSARNRSCECSIGTPSASTVVRTIDSR